LGLGYAFSFADQSPNFYALSSLNSGSAIGIFNDGVPTPSEAINENGLYYSFTLKAVATGSGNILFDPTPGANQYAADSTGFNFAPLPTGGPLAFSISSVPEPSSLVLGVVASLAGFGVTWCRRPHVSTRASRLSLECEPRGLPSGLEDCGSSPGQRNRKRHQAAQAQAAPTAEGLHRDGQREIGEPL
jgi:hypothetical protein